MWRWLRLFRRCRLLKPKNAQTKLVSLFDLVSGIHSFHSLERALASALAPRAPAIPVDPAPSQIGTNWAQSADIGTVSRSRSLPIILPSLRRSCISKSMVYAWALLRASIIVRSNPPVPWLEFTEISSPAFLLPEIRDSYPICLDFVPI